MKHEHGPSCHIGANGICVESLHEFAPGTVLVNMGDVKEIRRIIDGDSILLARIERSQGSFLRRVWVARNERGERICSGRDLAAVAHRAARIA